MLGAAKAPPKLTQRDLGLNKGSKCISSNHYKKCSWHISWYFLLTCNNCVEKKKFEKLKGCSYLCQMLAKLWDSLSKSSPNWRLTSQGVAKWFCKVWNGGLGLFWVDYNQVVNSWLGGLDTSLDSRQGKKMANRLHRGRWSSRKCLVIGKTLTLTIRNKTLWHCNLWSLLGTTLAYQNFHQAAHPC